MMFHLINFNGVRYGSGWLRIVPLPILFLVASQVSCAQVRNDLDAQETSTETSPVIIICPEIIITGESELLELLMSPQEVYQRYARQWNLIPERDTEILALTTAECDSNENSQYRCKDCKPLVATRRECAHASMDPEEPCQRQRFENGQVAEAKDICYVVMVNGKTCLENKRGTLQDCKVKRKPARRDGRGEQIEGSVYRQAFMGGPPFECIAQSQDVVEEDKMEMWSGCPTCTHVEKVRLRCVQHKRSRYPCGTGDLFTPIPNLDTYAGDLYECLDRCPEADNPETPRDTKQTDVTGGVNR